MRSALIKAFLALLLLTSTYEVATSQGRPTPSFDCRAAHTSIERAICLDPTLSDWDARMGKQFQTTLKLVNNRQPLLENQRQWLIQRDNACNSIDGSAVWTCLLEMTKSRIAALANFRSAYEEAEPSVSQLPSAASQQNNVTSAAPASSEIKSSSAAQSQRTNTNNPFNGLDLTPLILSAICAVLLFVGLRVVRASRRKRRLTSEYGAEVAEMIIARRVWQGMTARQLIESWGSPADIGREIIRTKTKETWKYGRTGKNRYSDRVYLENGVVIGWKN